MSHITTISVKIKDLDALAAAAAECGLVLDREQHRYEAYYGDGNTCHAAITTPGNAAKTSRTAARMYEVGVCQTAEEGVYELKFDEWQGGLGLIDKIGTKASKLIQAYSSHATVRAATKAGMSVKTERLPNGDIRHRLVPKQQAKAYTRW